MHEYTRDKRSEAAGEAAARTAEARRGRASASGMCVYLRACADKYVGVYSS